jgi:hypothetical protein
MRKQQLDAKFWGAIFGMFSAITTVIFLAHTVAEGYNWVRWIIDFMKTHWTVSALLGSFAVTSPAVIRFLPILKDPKSRRLVLQVLLWFAALLIPLLGLLVFYALWNIHQTKIGIPLPIEISGNLLLIVIALLTGIIAFTVININLTGPHRLYRDGLANTFTTNSINGNGVINLESINGQNLAPYHLINAALNLPSSELPSYQDRRCDFFMFSKHWLGAPSIGYHKTSTWKANAKPVDLATAMATSGAALSSHMGLGAMPTLTALLAFLNLRLGFWIKNPAKESSFEHPGFACLVREMLGIGMSEKQAWVNLSDGGHIENMAVYELLRRRCKFIVCVDGEADPEFTFGGLMTLVRHAQVDFGIRIEPNLDEIRPNKNTGYSKANYHFCRIQYPALNGASAGTGLLLYLKLSVTGNESELIKRYRINNPDFPHQTTLDQFFDQEQFEAYRQLGVHVAEGLFSEALMGAGYKPRTFEGWFKNLARNLLLPN